MEMHDIIKKNFTDMLGILYNDIKETIVNAGGFINTSKDGRDAIMSVEFVGGGEIAEWKVLGVRLVNDEIEYCADYDFTYEASDEAIMSGDVDEYCQVEWFSLKHNDNYYVQTLYNIWESLYEYVD